MTLEQFLMDWLQAHCDCSPASSHDFWVVFDDHASVDVRALAAALIARGSYDLR